MRGFESRLISLSLWLVKYGLKLALWNMRILRQFVFIMGVLATAWTYAPQLLSYLQSNRGKQIMYPGIELNLT